MRNIFLILLSFFIINMSFIWAYATNATNNIVTTQNTGLNIKWAKLIEKYLVWLTVSLTELKNKYKIKKNKDIELYMWKLQKMIQSLRAIQNTNVSKEKAENIMKGIIKRLKLLNPKIKKLLKIEKQKQKIELEKLMKKYYEIWIKLSKQLDKIILKILLPISKKNILNNNDKNIIKILKKLKIESDKLENLERKNIKTKTEMKYYLLRILKNIKKELSKIKT